MGPVGDRHPAAPRPFGVNTAHAGRAIGGVELDEKGMARAAALVERLDGLPIRGAGALAAAALSARPGAAGRRPGPGSVVDERLSEVDYGQWTGRKLNELVTEPLWSVVQQQPSAAVFPEARAWPRSSRARWPRSGSTVIAGWPPRTAPTCSGWPAPRRRDQVRRRRRAGQPPGTASSASSPTRRR